MLVPCSLGVELEAIAEAPKAEMLVTTVKKEDKRKT